MPLSVLIRLIFISQHIPYGLFATKARQAHGCPKRGVLLAFVCPARAKPLEIVDQTRNRACHLSDQWHPGGG